MTGAVVWDAPWYWGYWPYYNPYYTDVIIVNGTTIDYSQPIVVASPSARSDLSPTGEPSPTDEETTALLNSARNAFAQADYQTAMTLIDRAVAKKPNDTLLHEFRALLLFATTQYKAAAAAIHAVLSVGPGWDWATLSGFYPSIEVYTAQLRALERYRNANPNLAEVRFLLAYHYMSCGHPQAAATELKEVLRINPKDLLAGQLLAALSGESKDATPIPARPAIVAPSLPVNAASLVGNWTAARSDGSSFSFNLTDAATYSWMFAKNGKVQEYSGTYTVADGLLILKQNGNPVIIGQVTMLEANRFNFKLVGNNPGDPGLTFSKK